MHLLVGRKPHFNSAYLFMSTIHAMATGIVGVWFLDDFLFYWFFAGRCFVVGFYFLFENLVYGMLSQ
jgi:hypothetical protein